MVSSDIFNFLQFNTHFYESTLNQILFPKGSVIGKNRLSEGDPNFFLSNFPFANLQIKTIVESLRPIKSNTRKMKKKIRFSQKYAFRP